VHIYYCNTNILDSERSDECIDFTMMCVLDYELSDECIDFTMLFVCLAVLQEYPKDKIAGRITDFYNHCSAKNVSISIFIFLNIEIYVKRDYHNKNL
ncbi:reversion-inducing cysteine-rich protein with Kazal motifs, partial [Aphis craccivora]